MREDGRLQTVSGSGEAIVTAIHLHNTRGEVQEIFDVGAPVRLQVVVQAASAIPRLVLGYMIKDRLGQPIFGTNTHLKNQPLNAVEAGETITYSFDFPLNLGPGSYSVATALTSSETHLLNNYEWRDLALVFTVANLSRDTFVGSSWLDPKVHILRPTTLTTETAVK